MMNILRSALIFFLSLVFLNFSNGLPMQEISKLHANHDVIEAESKNADIPEWLKVATLIKYRIDESDERLKDMAEILSNNSIVINQVKSILVKIEKQKENPVICSLPVKEERRKDHAIAQAEISELNNKTDSDEIDGETAPMTVKITAPTRVAKRVDFLRHKIQALIKKLREEKNNRILVTESEIPPTCQDTFLIAGCNRFTSSDGLCHTEATWKLCCRSCSKAAILKVNP